MHVRVLDARGILDGERFTAGSQPGLLLQGLSDGQPHTHLQI